MFGMATITLALAHILVIVCHASVFYVYSHDGIVFAEFAK